MRICLGTVSKALFMSIVAKTVLRGGCFLLKPSNISCVREERWVVVECCGRKPCWEGASVMCGVICLRTSLSRIFDIVHSKEMGLYEDGLFGGLFGFKMGMIIAFFQISGILLCVQEKLNIEVTEFMA